MIKYIWILIGKKLNGEASPEELLELEELLKQGMADQYSISLLEEIWKSENQAQADEKLENKWLAFEDKLDAADKIEVGEVITPVIEAERTSLKTKIFKIIRFPLLIAACLLLAFYFFPARNITDNEKNNEIVAPQSSISKIQLPDGTKVWLNGGSKLDYGANYGTDFRNVTLTGEALFDVVNDEKHPFIVTTPTISIRVLGTRFNVRSYVNDRTSEAALIRGRIELTVLKNPEKKIILKASDKITIINNEQQSAELAQPAHHQANVVDEETPFIALSRIHQAKHDTLPSEALWVENKLAFDAEDFESLARKLERRYNVSITFKNEELEKLRFTGKFQNESIGKALKALQTSAYFHYKTNDNQILIY